MKVLVVDDEDDICELIQLILATDGHEVVTASNGAEALEALADTEVCALVLDVMMPGLGGIDVLRRIDGALPVLVLTASAEPHVERRCMQAGASMFMTKPFRIPQLQDAVRALVGRS